MPPEQNNLLGRNVEETEQPWFKSPSVILVALVIVATVVYLIFILDTGRERGSGGTLTLEEKEDILADLQTEPDRRLSEREKVNILSDLGEDVPLLPQEEKQDILNSLINI